MKTSWGGIGGSLGAALVATGVIAGVTAAWAHQPHQHDAAGAAAQQPATGQRGQRSVRIGMEELHRAGGVPPGWRFSWPAGDPQKGREVFVKLECYQCHEVKGESFPPVEQDPTRRGPALAGVGDHHPAEYFAESVINPNAVIVTGPGHTGPDGLSIMPDFRDSLTLAETIDLVAYIRSLTGDEAPEHAHHDAERERVVGPYRVRVLYAAPGEHGAHRHEHSGQGQSKAHTPKARSSPATEAAAGHLMVFVTDATRGEPLPYLPVTATLHAAKAAPRAVRLTPMLSEHGFHYGADVALPASLTRITVALGKPSPALRLTPAESTRFARSVEVSFDWGK
jgi:uncharacterized protein involved in high-affinity Fe2+ transport